MKKTGLLILGAVILLVGILAGTGPITAEIGDNFSTCGSAFSRNLEPAKSVDGMREAFGLSTGLVETCRDKIDDRKILAWGLVGLGAAVALGSLFLPGRSPKEP
jgi:hypothetical protein